MIWLIIVFVLGRLKIVENLELILAPRLHSVSNRTTHFRVLIPADTSGGRDGINIISLISSVAHLLELIVHTLLLRAMGSNRVILTLEQQVDVLEELVRDNRADLNFTLATNGMDNCASNDSYTDLTLQLTRSFTDIETASSRLPLRSSCIMLNFFKHQLNADARVRTHIHTSLYLHTLH